MGHISWASEQRDIEPVEGEPPQCLRDPHELRLAETGVGGWHGRHTPLYSERST